MTASNPWGQKIEPAARRPLAACWDGLANEFGRLMQSDVRRPVAALKLLAGAARTWIVAARIRRLVELPESLPRGAPGKPVRMDVASGRGNSINESLMACKAILVRLDQFLEPLPAALGAVELDHLKPVRSCINQRLPALPDPARCP